jgi:hypothetical protein
VSGIRSDRCRRAVAMESRAEIIQGLHRAMGHEVACYAQSAFFARDVPGDGSSNGVGSHLANPSESVPWPESPHRSLAQE